MTAIKILYWACIALILYHHVGYPILLRLIARFRRSPLSSHACSDAVKYHPSVTIIIPCHNEGAVIAAKIENIAQLEYPSESLSVVLVLDGCTDNTRLQAQHAIARLSDRCTWRIADYRQNLGKVGVLNEEISHAQSDIIALSDASALVNSDALLRAAVHFSAADVGVVCGTYSLQDNAEAGERAYRAYQKQLKIQEARVAVPMGAHGAFYLFRRALWTKLPPDTINDDFILPMRIVCQGYRAIYDEKIVATELEQTVAGQDFRRRMRIGAGNVQQFMRLLALGNPRKGMTALIFLSGKGLRAMTPFIVAIAFLLSAVLAVGGDAIYVCLFFAKVALFSITLIASAFPGAAKVPLIGHIAYATSGLMASGWGSMLLLSGRHASLWKLSTKSKSRA